MSDWLPIKTAPPRVDVDIWVDGTRVPDACFLDGVWKRWSEAGYVPVGAEPTHWMPLPEPPK